MTRLLLLSSLLFPPALVQAAQSASQRFAVLAEEYWDTSMRLDPLSATFYNHPRYHDRLPDNSAAGRAAERKELGALLQRLKTVPRKELNAVEQVSWDVMKVQIDLALEAQQHKFWQWDVDHMDGPQSWIPTVAEVAQPMATDADAEAYLKRLAGLPRLFENQVANLRDGLKEGRVAARAPVEKTIRQLEELVAAPADKSPFAAAAKRLPDESRAKRLPEIVAAVNEKVKPAFAAYLAFLKDEYLAKARAKSVGLSALPRGAEAYAFKIRLHTTLPKTPGELHRVGLDELNAIEAEMTELAKRSGHSGTLAEFRDKVRADKKNYFETREEVLKSAEAFVAKATAELPKWFGILPKTPLVVKPVEEYKEKNETAARYFPPPDDLSRPGVFYVNTYAPETRDRYSMTSLAVHEGVPGHHMQIAIAAEQRGLPTFRRNAGFNAYVEGWALYAERLAVEMGLYEDDLSRYGMLADQAWRACRLVVDTGIHGMGWSRQKAIDFMKEHTPKPADLIETEVDRYIIWPGQALSYKVGQREIMALREESRKALGDKFDVRAFHDTVLKNGAVPLPTLRAIVLGAR